jgi:hypothetical protein
MEGSDHDLIVVLAWHMPGGTEEQDNWCPGKDLSQVLPRYGVRIVTGYGLDSPGSIPSMARLLSSPQHPDWLWGPPSLLSNRYWGQCSRG